MVTSVFAHSLKEALEYRRNPKWIPYCGGTDLMVEGDEGAAYLFVNQVPEMRKILVEDNRLRLGAAVTFTEILNAAEVPQILKEAMGDIAAPAIRNAGSIGGNIGNGSAKADSALVFMVADADLRLASADGERILPIKDFYLGRKHLALKPDELIVEVIMPYKGLENYYYQKVGARDALAISRLSFAGIMELEGDKIKNFATAFGAVADVILRPKEIDAIMIGKTLEEAKALKEEYLKAIDAFIVPIRGRVSVEYRKDVAMNLLKDFLEVKGL
ncbi:MAG: FAD binding domain-containing protein [Lachnospiraceae bacterium]|nr:FAD binding domain-containing protein [Lachnospiraceae bacterium]